MRRSVLGLALALLAGCASSPPPKEPRTAEVSVPSPPAGERAEPAATEPEEADPEPAERAPRRGNKVAECNSLIEIINKGVDGLSNPGVQGPDPSGTRALRAMADRMDEVARQVTTVELTLPELLKYKADYQEMARNVARAARDMAGASEAKDLPGVNKAQEDLDRAVKQEDPLVDGINKFCQSSP